MKNLIITSVCIIFGLTAVAQDKNARAVIEVDGVCGMCKERIEKAAIKTKGVKTATWSIETHMLSLIFDENKTSLQTIEESIAATGHDTKNVTAPEEAYESLHHCCKYRDEEVVGQHPE
jgi:mercuric ion binding protein